MLLHAKDASQSGMKEVLIHTLDTDAVAISVGLFEQLDLLEIWLPIESGKHMRCLEIHKITAALRPKKSNYLSLFHAFN